MDTEAALVLTMLSKKIEECLPAPFCASRLPYIFRFSKPNLLLKLGGVSLIRATRARRADLRGHV
jgi:hypothetical protein